MEHIYKPRGYQPKDTKTPPPPPAGSGSNAIDTNTINIIYCKDCKFYEKDVLVMYGGIPIIAAHNMCHKWGDGCKTKEDGFCFMAEEGTYGTD